MRIVPTLALLAACAQPTQTARPELAVTATLELRDATLPIDGGEPMRLVVDNREDRPLCAALPDDRDFAAGSVDPATERGYGPWPPPAYSGSYGSRIREIPPGRTVLTAEPADMRGVAIAAPDGTPVFYQPGTPVLLTAALDMFPCGPSSLREAWKLGVFTRIRSQPVLVTFVE